MTALPARYAALKDKKLLVTGAAGFIGGDLYQRLRRYGLDPLGTVLYAEEAKKLRADGGRADVLDLTDDGSWDDIVRGADIVFHIAAMFQEVEQPRSQYDLANNSGALKLAETAARVGVERFVHCSTVGVYGDVKEVPVTEQTPYNPMDIYHETKLAGELAIMALAEQQGADGMVVTVNRPAMVYGPGDLRMLKLFRTILSGQFRMIGSGETLAHLGYIEDQTESFLLQAIAPRENVHGQGFNIASNEPMTLNALASLIAEVGGVKLARLRIPLAPVWLAALACEIVCAPFRIKPPLFRRRVGFFTHNRAFDLSRAREALNYESAFTDREAITRTIRWYRENELI